MPREMQRNFYEAMLSRMEELGYEDPPLMEPDVAEEILADAAWEEREPIERRLCNLRGMTEWLRCRPAPATFELYVDSLAMIDELRRLGDWADELDREEPECFAEEMLLAASRCRFEDAMFAATQEFFELVERLEEAEEREEVIGA